MLTAGTPLDSLILILDTRTQPVAAGFENAQELMRWYITITQSQAQVLLGAHGSVARSGV